MTMENINDRILLYIKENAKDGWTEINDLLRKENKGDAEIKVIIRGLIDKKLLTLKGDQFRKLGSSSGGHRFTVDNVLILARLLADGEQRLDEIKMKDKPNQIINIGRDNKGEINQFSESTKTTATQPSKNNSTIKQIVIGLVVTIAGGLILYWIVKEFI